MPVQDELPTSRGTIVYTTEVNGQLAQKELPARFLVMGDFSHGTSKDRREDLDTRQCRSLDGQNTNQVMKDMGISLSCVVPNKVNPDEESMRVDLSFKSMKSFSPEEVARQLPQIRSLMLLKQLLEEIQSNIANKKEFSALLNKLLSNKALVAGLREKLKDFSSYQIPEVVDPHSVESNVDKE